MFIPSTNFCPSSLFSRDTVNDVTSTADSFKHWDTCMDNKTCKIVAIVGIVLAAIFVLWIITTIVQCLCMGLSCLEALCCCCCRSVNKGQHPEKVSHYNNPNMYAAAPPPTYAPAGQYPYNGIGYNQGYSGMGNREMGNARVYDDEDPFAEHGKHHGSAYRG